MPILLKSVTGLFAEVVVGTVNLALWLPDETKPVDARALIAAPQPVAASARAPAGVEKAALDKLAQAMGLGQPNSAEPASGPARAST